MHTNVSLVTGAASGIGAAVAKRFASDGAKVALADVNQTGLNKVAESIRAGGGHALAVRLNVTSEADWATAISTVLSNWGRLDILVNCAGIAFAKPIPELELADWRRVIETNLDGVFLGTKAAMAAMKTTGGGGIINIASAAGIKPLAGNAAYGTSKAAIHYFTQIAALEGKPLGIRVNSISPGAVATPMWRGTEMWPGETEAKGGEKVALDELVQDQGFARAEEVAGAVAYLVSDEARHITGADLAIDADLRSGDPRAVKLAGSPGTLLAALRSCRHWLHFAYSLQGMEASQHQPKRRPRRVTPTVVALTVAAGVVGLVVLSWAGSRTKIIGDMYLGSVGTNTGVCLKLERHGSTVEGLMQFLDRDRGRVELTGRITASGITGRFTGFNDNEHGTINLTGTDGMEKLTGSWQEWPESEPEPLALQRVGQLAQRNWRSGFRFRNRGQRLNAEMTYPVLPTTNRFADALAETVEAIRRAPPMVEEGVTWDMIRFGLRYGGMRDWESKTAIDIVHLTDTCMSLRVFGWADTGGAHGNWVVYGVNLIKEGDHVGELTLEDIFTEGSGWFTKVSRPIIEGLREQEASGAMGEDFTLNRVDLTFTVSERGLVFMFSPYEVASYAEGAFFVTVPWGLLRPMLWADIGPELLPDQELHK